MKDFMLNASLSMVPEDVLPSAWVGHLPFSFWLIEQARPDILVELGTHNGTSFLAFCQAIKERGVRTKAFAVDTWEGDEHSGHYGDEVHAGLDGLVKAKYAGFAQLMRMLFDEAAPYFSDGSIDLLHIDGLHTYEAVKHDFETWLPKMSRRGVVIFHDTMVRERAFGVWQLWEELRDRYPSFEFKHTHGLGVLLVGDSPPKALAALCSLTGTPREAVMSNLFDAMGQRFTLLERIGQLEARNAIAVQHAANYQSMYESTDASLRRAMDNHGTQLEARHKQVEAASAQIAALNASIELLTAGFRSQMANARRELELAASSVDIGAQDHGIGALVQDIRARSAERQRLLVAAEEAQTRLAQALALSEGQLASALGRVDELRATHDSQLAELRSRFDAERSAAQAAFDLRRGALLQGLQASEASLVAIRQQMDELRALHAREVSAASAHFEALQADAHAVFNREREAMSQALLASEAARAGLESDLQIAGTKRAADVSALQAQLRDGEALAQDLRSRLGLRENELLRLVNSKSWRITAPMRWLRGQWVALRKGTPAPTYTEVLEVPFAGVRQSPTSGEVAFSSDATAPRASYLQALFADTAARRSPDYVGPAQAPSEAPASVRAKAIAFYLPQFHCFPENEAWWGAGFTEWTNVTQSVAQFVGHEQPQLPTDLGFYDLRVPEVFRRQIDLARRYGIHGFCFHYYWFGGKRLMEKPLELYLAQQDLDFPFCLCWANESWTRRWDGREDEVLVAQEHGAGDDLAFIRDLERYLRDPRYIRVDGRPLLVVYRASLLPDAQATLERWRRYCRDAGIGEIFVAMAQFDLEDPSSLGFDAALEFPPHKLAKGFDGINQTLDIVNPDYQGIVFHYQSIVDSAKTWPDRGFPLIRGVFPGWDNEARRPGKGYTFAFSTPARYREWLEFAVDYAQAHPVAGESIVMINAWNEWAEGAKLEPDARYGHAYLHATRQALDAHTASDEALATSVHLLQHPESSSAGADPSEPPGVEHASAASDEEFDVDFYLLQYPDIPGAGVDPHECAAAQEPLATEAESFDAYFYLLQYPDIASAGVDPYTHYFATGKGEGRHATRPRLIISEGGIAFDSARETVLVLAHEASRTGAPVLSLNLVTALNQRYNVIAMLLGDGPLTEDFRSECTWLAGPMDLRGSPARATVIIDELMTLHRPKFAVANSIECMVVLEPLARHGVVTISLVHEFAAYTRPRAGFRSALLWADETVFSTPLTRESVHFEFPEFADRAFTVLPQGRCSLPASSQDEESARREDARLLAALRPGGPADDAFVVLGAGFVQQRKGVDLFIQCAGQVMASERGRNCRFVWIGSGYDPEGDMGYSVYLADQLRRSGLDKIVRIVRETSRIETAYRAADALLLSSRLDPLPNVAIDAMAHGLPVVCFDRSSGIADVLVEEGLRGPLVAGYLDVNDMASKLLELVCSPALRQEVRERVLDVVERRFSMASYVGALETLARESDARLARRAQEVDEVMQSGLFRADFHASRQGSNEPVENVIEFEYLRSWDYAIDRRKPFPGFHPGVYRSLHGLAQSGDPLVDFLRAGRPAGPWLTDVVSPEDDAAPHDANARIALHLHVFYPDMLPNILVRLAENLVRPDLFISVPDDAAMVMVELMLASYDGRVVQVKVVPNRGRDIGPFLTAFGGDWSAYDVVGHLHTKKSLDLNDAAFSLRWNEFLMENLLGGRHPMADAIVGRLLADPGLGLIYPDDPHVMGWSGNRAHGEDLAGRLGITGLPDEFNFPIGTMFWARPAALASLVGLGLKWDDYPGEPLGYDGTMLHAIERLLPSVVAASGFRYAVTNVPGVTR